MLNLLFGISVLAERPLQSICQKASGDVASCGNLAARPTMAMGSLFSSSKPHTVVLVRSVSGVFAILDVSRRLQSVKRARNLVTVHGPEDESCQEQ